MQKLVERIQGAVVGSVAAPVVVVLGTKAFGISASVASGCPSAAHLMSSSALLLILPVAVNALQTAEATGKLSSTAIVVAAGIISGLQAAVAAGAINGATVVILAGTGAVIGYYVVDALQQLRGATPNEIRSARSHLVKAIKRPFRKENATLPTTPSKL